MDNAKQDLSAQFQQLQTAFAELRLRVEALEGRERSDSAAIADTGIAAALPVETGAGTTPFGQTASLVPLFGWAFLGLSGAYFLRALTEAGTIPSAAGAVAGILYAGWWLFLAARRTGDHSLAATVHGVTAALILAPMLWETTVRFHSLSVTLASAVLVAFVAFALAVGWRRNITAIAAVTVLAGLVTATAMFRETHDARAWVLTILAIAAALEFSACRDHWLRLRWVVALFADFSVVALTGMAVRQAGAAGDVMLGPPEFVLGCQVALSAIYLASTVDRTLFRRLLIRPFEIGQAVAAFLVSVGGALQLAGATRIGNVHVGALCLAAGLACYVISYALLEKGGKRDRNFYTYSTFAIVLMVVATALLLSHVALAATWSLLGVASLCSGLLTGRLTLRAHAAVYLLLAVAVSGLAGSGLAAVMRMPGQATAAIGGGYWFALVAAVLCYSALILASQPVTRVESVFLAAVVVLGTVGLLSSIAGRIFPEAAPIRTAVLSAAALTLAYSGSRWSRKELNWLVYPVLAVTGLKLVMEDLRMGSSLPGFVSLILFGGTLILLPKLMRAKTVQQEPVTPEQPPQVMTRRAGV